MERLISAYRRRAVCNGQNRCESTQTVKRHNRLNANIGWIEKIKRLFPHETKEPCPR